MLREELASLMGLDPKALADTISTYNGYAAGAFAEGAGQ